MDKLARFNRQRWDALAEADIAYSRPWLDLDETRARSLIDPEGILSVVRGARVLCLAGGGGQQSAAFGLLGADVTIVDFSDVQLQRDREAAEHYGHTVRTISADMRDLSQLATSSFDIVWHAHAIAFIPDVNPVFDGVARLLRPGGMYRLECHNPFSHGVDASSWTGSGYVLSLPYEDGAEVVYDDPHWDVTDRDGFKRRIIGPREFRHTLSTVVNGLVARGLVLLGLWERGVGDPGEAPGTWQQFTAVAPPYLSLWATTSADRVDLAPEE